MGHYRKKPVVIEAFQMTEAARRDNSEWPDWLHEAWNKAPGEPGALLGCNFPNSNGTDPLRIVTLEGALDVSWGDWIIRGTAGELYPCKPDIFADIYDPAFVPPAEGDEQPVGRTTLAGDAELQTGDA